jgi:hypothetical protein
MSSDRHLAELRALAQYRRQRLDLYRAKTLGAHPTHPGRLEELEREYALAASALERATRDTEAGAA